MEITKPVTRHLTRAKFQVPVYRLANQNGMSIIARACYISVSARFMNVAARQMVMAIVTSTSISAQQFGKAIQTY